MPDEATGDAHHDQMTRKHVVAVNGAAEFLEMVRVLLQDESYNVTTTNYLPRTFDLIAALGPDLIILDLAVGQQAGWNLMERLQTEAATHGIPVLLTSTDPELLDRAAADPARYGAHQSILKPLDIDELLRTVHELIGLA